jgi:hypothetical protein
LNKKAAFLWIVVVLFSLNLHAGFFGDLFEKRDQDIQITQEDPVIDSEVIYEEEVISADDYIDSVDEPTDIEVFSDNENESKAFDENEVYVDEDGDEDPFIRSQSIFLSYVDKPEKIYLSQHASIKIKAVVTQENISSIQTSFLKHKNITILNNNSSWIKTSNNSYENSYIIKVLSTSAVMPDIKVAVSTLNGKQYSETLSSYQPKIVALREDKEFCLVLSRDLTLQSHHQKKYDEKTNIVVLEINATDANLEDFHIPYAIRDGIDDIKYSGKNQTIYYFAIIPNSMKMFKFKYFDLVSNKYNIVSFPVVLQDSSVSTQTDLNPEESRFALYKAIALIVLAFIIFLFYLKTKKLYLLILSLIVGFFVFYIRMPISKIILDKNVKLRILPTKNSTVFYKTEQSIKADILLKKDGYIKVLLPNKKIGWIDEDITKN